MLRVTQSGEQLIVSYAPWLGLLLLAMGVALAVYLFRGKAPTGKAFGVAMAALVCCFGAWHFLWYRVTLGPEGASLRATFGRSAEVRWPDLATSQVELRPGGRGGTSNYTVLRSTDGTEVPIPTTGLSADELTLLVDYLGKRATRR
jgi:hypothetical protein